MRVLFPKKPLLDYYKWLCKQMDDSVGRVSGLGVHSFTVFPDKINLYFDLESLYGRKGLVIKVFTDPITDLEHFTWGKMPFLDCLKIQNIMALHHLAPRIYDIVIVPFRQQRCYAVITDYASGSEGSDFGKILGDSLNSIRELLPPYGFSITSIDPNETNTVGKWYVDFQNFCIENADKFKQYILDTAGDRAGWGAAGKVCYQSIPELGIEGQRDTYDRLKVLRADTVDFRDKTVLDIGCSAWSFCRYAARQGAKRVVGIDIGNIPMAAAEISTYLGDMNIDYVPYQFGNNDRNDYYTIQYLTGLDSFDIVFFLSVNVQVGYPKKYMGELCKETLFLEGHSADKEETYRKMLEQDFSVVEFTGIMKNNSRPAFLCLK